MKTKNNFYIYIEYKYPEPNSGEVKYVKDQNTYKVELPFY